MPEPSKLLPFCDVVEVPSPKWRGVLVGDSVSLHRHHSFRWQRLDLGKLNSGSFDIGVQSGVPCHRTTMGCYYKPADNFARKHGIHLNEKEIQGLAVCEINTSKGRPRSVATGQQRTLSAGGANKDLKTLKPDLDGNQL